jgi:release factor glutamine methyltransferase
VSTIRQLLVEGQGRLTASGSESPRLDVELLLAHALGSERTAVIAHPDAPVGADAETLFRGALDRRAAGEPVAYIRGFKEFHGLAFATDPRALIPRPDTEVLVELAIDQVVRVLTGGEPFSTRSPLSVVDVGTGAGTVAISLGVALRRRRMLGDVEILGTDVDPSTLALAIENAVGHGVADRVRFVEADLLPPVIARPFRLLTANLPYIPSAEVDRLPVAASFEPRAALDGGPDGLDLVRRLLERLPDALDERGTALLEIGADQADAVRTAVLERLPGWRMRLHDDLAGRPRVARVER